MYDPLARQALKRVVARRTVTLKELLKTIEPEALVSRSVEETVDAVLDGVVLAPLVLDVAALVGPERTPSGGWLWAAPLVGPHDLTARLPSRWFILPLASDDAGPPSLVFMYDDDGMTEDEAWRFFQGDWRDALAWIADVDDLIRRAGRRWRAVATRDITARIQSLTRAGALTPVTKNS